MTKSQERLLTKTFFPRVTEGKRCANGGLFGGACGGPLHVSHILPKGSYRRLKFHPHNLLALCLKHHLYWWHKNPVEAWVWLQGALPRWQVRWLLAQRHRSGKVPTVDEVKGWWK